MCCRANSCHHNSARPLPLLPKFENVVGGFDKSNVSLFRESVCNFHLTPLLQVQVLALSFGPGAEATSPISFLLDRTVVAHTESGPALPVQ